MKRLLAVIAVWLGIKGASKTPKPTQTTSGLAPGRHELRWTLGYSITIVAFLAAVANRSWWLSAGALVASGIQLTLSTAGAIARATYDRAQDTFQSPQDTTLAHQTPVNESQVGVSAVLIGLVVPEMLFVRIKEHVSPLTKAFHVRTAYTIHMPLVEHSENENTRPANEYVPLILSEKGILHDDLSVTIAGSECATASFEESVEIASIVARQVAIKASRNHEEYLGYEASLHPQIRRIVSSRRSLQKNSIPIDPTKERIARRRRGRKIRNRIRKHFDESPYRDLLELIVATLATHYVIYAAVDRTQIQPGGMLVIETRERHMLAPRTRELLRVPTTGLGALGLRIGNALRIVYGMSPSDIVYPLSKALRAGSYHLEIMGFDGSYLSRQRYYSALGTRLAYRRFRSRRGQRYAHLYLRDMQAEPLGGPKGWNESPFVAVEFDERPPGSFAAAGFSSLAATLVLVAASRMAAHPQAGATDIVALLMAAPGAILGWSGFLTEPRRFGSVATRFSATLTLLLSLAGFLQFTLGGSPRALISGDGWLFSIVGLSPATLSHYAWISIAVLSIINTVLIWSYWGQRAIVHMTFVDDEVAGLISKLRKALTGNAEDL